jgi:hypothetical protein
MLIPCIKKPELLKLGLFRGFKTVKPSVITGGLERTFRAPMLSFGGSTVESSFLWPTIRPRAVVIYPLIAFGASSLSGNARTHLRLPLGRPI